MPNTDLLLARTIDEDRQRGLDRRHAIGRARRDGGEVPSPGWSSRLAEATRRLLRSPGRSSPIGADTWVARVAAGRAAGAGGLLTDLPCCTPDGRRGRVEVILADGAWTLACRMA